MDVCGQDEMQQLTDRISVGTGDAINETAALAARFPADPRLQFMLGSMLIETGRAIEAHAALSRAIELAPGYAIARFQLGFFELTSGEVDRAMTTWAPLDALAEGDYLRHFVTGLRHLVRDEFSDTIARLRDGIAANVENPPLNRDMQLIIDRCALLIDGAGMTLDHADRSEASTTSLLLDQLANQRTVH